jgi:hypothetical protein
MTAAECIIFAQNCGIVWIVPTDFVSMPDEEVTLRNGEIRVEIQSIRSHRSPHRNKTGSHSMMPPNPEWAPASEHSRPRRELPGAAQTHRDHRCPNTACASGTSFGGTMVPVASVLFGQCSAPEPEPFVWIRLSGEQPDLEARVAEAAHEARERGSVPLLHLAPTWNTYQPEYARDPRVQKALQGVTLVQISVAGAELPGALDAAWCHPWHQGFAALTDDGRPAAPLAWSGTKDGPLTAEEYARFLAIHVEQIRAAGDVRPVDALATADCTDALIPAERWRDAAPSADLR